MSFRDRTSQLRHLSPRGEEGQAFAEFALVLPLLMAIVFAVIGFGDVFWKYQQLSAAVSEGARKAIVSRTASDPAGTAQQAAWDASVNLHKDLGSKGAYTVTSSCPSGAPTGCHSWGPGSNVTVEATMHPKLVFFGNTLTLHSQRTMRVE